MYVYAHVCTLLCLDLQRFLFFANGHTLCRQQRQKLSFGLSNNSIAGTQRDSNTKKTHFQKQCSRCFVLYTFRAKNKKHNNDSD